MVVRIHHEGLNRKMPYSDKDKQKEYQRTWMKTRREEYLKQFPVCVRCGSNRHLRVHHKDPKIKISHRVWSWCKENREAELAKCIVICAACHSKEHCPKCDLETSHGTTAAYRTHGCRCDLCIKAAVLRRKELKKKREGTRGFF